MRATDEWMHRNFESIHRLDVKCHEDCSFWMRVLLPALSPHADGLSVLMRTCKTSKISCPTTSFFRPRNLARRKVHDWHVAMRRLLLTSRLQERSTASKSKARIASIENRWSDLIWTRFEVSEFEYFDVCRICGASKRFSHTNEIWIHDLLMIG
jgi:hypothetical protein